MANVNTTAATASQTFNTRIQLKYDTFANWTEKNPVLLAGEVAIATIGATDANKSATGFQNLPNVVIKVGDGSSRYNSLKFVSGLAADVYEWAKADTKPSYNASEIQGLTEYVQNISDVDTNTEYKLTVVDASTYKYKLEKREYANNAWGAWADAYDLDLSDIDSRLDALEAFKNGYSKDFDDRMEDILDKLDFNIEGVANVADSTVDVLKQENGVISATYKKIAITHDQVTDWATTVKAITDPIDEELEDLDIRIQPIEEFVIEYPEDVDGRIEAAINKLDFAGVSGSQTGSTISFVNTVSEENGVVSAATASVELTGVYNAETNKIATQDYVKEQVADLTGAMHFIGMSSTNPAEGTVTVEGKVYTGVAGDIVIFEAKEYVCDKTGAWVELGDEGSAAAQIAKLNATVNNAEGAAYTVASVVQSNGVLTEVKTQKIQIAMDQVTGLSDEFSGVDTRIQPIEEDVADHEERIVALEETAEALDTTIGDKINAAIEKLDKADAEVEGQYVSAVSEENGVITVSRKALPTIPTLSLKDNGDVDVSTAETVTVVATVGASGHEVSYTEAEVATKAGVTAAIAKLDSVVDAQNETVLADADNIIKVLTKVTQEDGVLNPAASEAVTLHKVAKTGNIADLEQTAETYIIFNCGTASVNI